MRYWVICDDTAIECECTKNTDSLFMLEEKGKRSHVIVIYKDGTENKYIFENKKSAMDELIKETKNNGR